MLTIGYNYLHDVSSKSAKTVRMNILFHKFAITNTIFGQLIISDMHHRITYMYTNFQQNWVNTNRAHKYICKNCKLHKFAAIEIKLF